MTRPVVVPELVLVAEARVEDLFPAGGAGRMEASGVLAVDDGFLIVFDDSRNIGRIGRDLADVATNRVFTPSSLIAPVARDGFEDITFDPVSGSYYLLIEAAERDDGGWMAKIETLDARFGYLSQSWLPFPLPDAGKGMEGLTCAVRDGMAHLLAICEGNRCQGGKAGKLPGGGRIQIFAPASDEGRQADWQHTETINLPESLWFTDFSSISASGDRIAVTSQESSALWIGRLEPASWELVDDGTVYEFPRDRKGRAIYCLVEGVSWINSASGQEQFVVVSDRAKSSTPGRCSDKQQSAHIFEVPAGRA